jgi:hypothetical protein
MVHDEKTAALEGLAAAFPSQTYATVLTCGTGRQPTLHIVNRDLPRLAGDVYAEDGWFWWHWAERIARTSDPVTAAAMVARVLRVDAVRR